jgi:hypothetical protein
VRSGSGEAGPSDSGQVDHSLPSVTDGAAASVDAVMGDAVGDEVQPDRGHLPGRASLDSGSSPAALEEMAIAS